MLSIEKQLKFLNEIVYKRSQSIQTIHMMAPKVSTYNGRPTLANPRYLKQAQSEIPCLYAFPYDQSTHANRLISDGEETLALEREKIVDNAWIKHSKDQFRAPTAQDMDILIQTCLMPLAIKTQNDSFIFVHELKQEMHANLKYIESLEKEIDELESDKAKFSNIYDMILQECVSNNVMCSYLLSLSDLDTLAELQCLYLHKVKECDCLAQKLSNQTESVSKNDTVWNEQASNVFRKEREQYIEIHDLKAQQQNKNIAISELKKLIEKGKGKYVDTKFDKPSVVRQPNAQRIPKPSVLVDSDHFACVTKMLNNVNARTKKPNVVPISTRKPKGHTNKSGATPHKKKVASKSTNQISQSYYRMLYEKTSKTWKWWIEQQSPSGYKWVSKTKMQWVPKSKNETVQKRIVQLILFIVDSGCMKHMTGNLKLLCNFVEKFLGTVRFDNDQFVPILGYGDLVQGNITINGVYYVKGLNHNLFSVGQFCDADLENRHHQLHSVSWLKPHQLKHSYGIEDFLISTLTTSTCFQRRMSKYVKDQLRSFFELSKVKRSSFKSKAVLSSKGRINLLHMDLCGPIRVASINEKKYILVIIDDYSRYTWTLFLHSKDETPEVLKEFLTMNQINLQALVITVRTERRTEFLNKTLNAFFKEEGIEHQTSTARTSKENGVVERQNRTLIYIIPTHDKMTYHIINDRKPSIKHLHIFGCTCYITRDGKNLDKMKEKGDLCILVGYSNQSKGYRVYNKRIRLIVESIHIRFDEIKEVLETFVANDTLGLVPQRQKASDYDNSDTVPQLHNVSSSADAHVPLQQELDLLFGHLYDEFFNAAEEHLPDDEFTKPFCAPTQKVAESSSHNIAMISLRQFLVMEIWLSHLNFDYINLISKKDIVIGLPKLKDCENLDKIREKGYPCILVGYSTQSKGYRVYNKRTRMIVKSIHIRFDEIKEVSETFVANGTSSLVPHRQNASDYDNPDLVPQRQDVSSSADAHVPSQQELDLIFGPLYDELFNAGSNPQDKQPPTNIESTSAPSAPIFVHAEENNDDQAEEGEHLQDDE
nr:hypothetical protein [Tanacetum cinerariifolium]